MAIRHVVFVKFKTSATPAEIEQFATEVNRIPAANREVHNWFSGRAPEPRFYSGDFDWALSGDLDDWDAMDRYAWHPAHLRLGPYTGVIDYMIAFDFTNDCDFAQGKNIPAPPEVPPLPGPVPAGMARVPVLRSHDVKDAKRLIGAAGLTVAAEIDYVNGSVFASGRVIGSVPDEGEVVAVGSPVRLTVAGNSWVRPAL